MSDSKNQDYQSWEAFAATLRSTEITHSMEELSRKDQNTCRDVLLYWCMILNDEFISTSPQGMVPVIHFRKNLLYCLMRYMQTRPIDELLDCLKAADEDLLSPQLRGAQDGFVLGFKHRLRCFPKGLKWLGNTLLQCIPWDDPIRAIASAHQCLSFPLRVNLAIGTLGDQSLASWMSTQENIPSGLDYSPVTRIVESWFSTMDVTLPFARHGNGAVYLCTSGSTTSNKATKYRESEWSPLMTYVDRKYFDGELAHPFGKEGCEPMSSKLAFVPKSYSKLRSIAMEPPGKQWYQQAGLDLFDRHFRTDKYLRRRIRLHDASHNRTLAQEGSLDGSLATIDLSAASDSVSWELAKAAFAHTPIYPLLLAARTREVKLPSGDCVELRSHATMGSALCFPVECVVFAALCELAVQDHGHDPRRSRYSVYGDDIVIETCYVPRVVSLLRYYGFQVNSEKSFWDQCDFRFRESCGGEYVNGVEVTPIRISRRYAWNPGGVTPKQFLARIELANQCWLRYPTLRLHLIRSLLTLPCRLRPLFVDAGVEGGLITDQPTNFHLQIDRKRSSDYQRRVFLYGTAGSDPPDVLLENEEIRLYEWLHYSRRERQAVHECVPGVVVPLTAIVDQSRAIKLKTVRSPI